MSFSLLGCEVEKGKKAGPIIGPALCQSFLALNFRQVAALRLRSRRALSSAHCGCEFKPVMKQRKQPSKSLVC